MRNVEISNEKLQTEKSYKILGLLFKNLATGRPEIELPNENFRLP